MVVLPPKKTAVSRQNKHMIEFSDIQNSYYILPLIGFAIGLFGSMIGGGGGFFFLPVLTLLMNVPVQTAVITSLTATLPICMVGSWGHWRKGNIDFNTALVFIVVGIAGAFAGAKINGILTERQLKIAFGAYSILIAINMIINVRKKQKAEGEGQNKSNHFMKTAQSTFFGLVAGIITGTFGTSGTAPVIAGLFSLKIALKMVIGTSLLILLSNTIFAIGAHYLVGKIDLTLVCFLTAGSTIGALAGPRLLAKARLEKAENSAGYWYAAIMVVIGVLMIIGKTVG